MTSYGVKIQDYATLEWAWAADDAGTPLTWDKQELAQRQADALRQVDQRNDARVEPIPD